MLEQSNGKRVIFKKGEQSRFLLSAMDVAKITSKELAALAHVSMRQVSRWIAEEYTLPLFVATTISKRTAVSIPANVKYVEQFAHTSKAGQKGGKSTIKLYGRVPGSEKTRLSAWKRWWEDSGRDKVIAISKKQVSFPEPSTTLAEFTGIMMGDGGLSKHQICVTLNLKDDLEYSFFVGKMMEQLFAVKPSRNMRAGEKAICLVISRVDLVNYCHEHLNLPIGHKIRQGLFVPSWILNDKEYPKDFIRGLIDTDGCVVIEKHSIKGKVYSYIRLNITTYCEHLSSTVFSILTSLGFHPKMRRGGKSIQLENYDEICDYFRAVGTSNQKHIDRFNSVNQS